MNTSDVQNHIEDMKNEISDLLFFLATVEREIEIIQPKIESKIVKPNKTINLSNITQQDLEVDVVPIKLANMELVQLRKSFHYAKIERANTIAAIEAKKQMLSSYVEHVKRELSKEAKPCTNEMISDAYNKAKALKNISQQEQEVLTDISDNLLKILNSGKQRRIELYDTLQNLIKQHGL